MLKELYYIARRTDFDNINLWSNYTNWVYEDIDPLSYKYLNECRMYYDNLDSQNIFFDKYLANATITTNQT